MYDVIEYCRTEPAGDRMIFAVERTCAGRMRTSFAAIGIGLACSALHGGLDPLWLARFIATLCILLAAFLAITAERRALRAVARLKSHPVDAPDAPHLRHVAWAVAAGSVILAVTIRLLEGAETPFAG